MTSSVEKGIQRSPHGLPGLASFTARDPDHETYIFRRFNDLTARNLLHLQSELLDLRQQLCELDSDATSSTASGELKVCMQNPQLLHKLAAERDGPEKKLVMLLEKVERKLDKYQRAVLQASEMARLKGPSARVKKAYQDAFSQMNISGPAAKMLDEQADLIALKPPPEVDPLSYLVREHWPFPTTKLSAVEVDRARHFQERRVRWVVSSVSISIAALLLVGSIITLYLVRNPDVRLGLLIVFILLFAIGIRISTSASRENIFAATAAYAAVLVVFVSGDLGRARVGQR
ncbi:hypothetical protein CB0940_10959 [Cercospora beticola]|uniref:DUF6594 domain-containing protein n=1 Tax=Cercospora beticola TaxID=122368 RepID=A0A2G5HF55_CERBT|nr:hypothetical protein CB0940_10959 [Cercospora beticola]PIA90862.1 hypothetical protein CB0940_10959 [Cercospora beticola]WPB07691.1 hypothetical protein RHO25_012352 [Cercospora beticola]CAK1356504.1 unnamed protein product [Cercospora beticola]